MTHGIERDSDPSMSSRFGLDQASRKADCDTGVLRSHFASSDASVQRDRSVVLFVTKGRDFGKSKLAREQLE